MTEWPVSHEMESHEVQHLIDGAKFGFCDSRFFVGTRFKFLSREAHQSQKAGLS